MSQLHALIGRIRRKRVLYLSISILSLLFGNGTLYANHLTLQFLPTSDTITEYRYQINGEDQHNWITSSVSQSIISLGDFEKTQDTIYIQQSDDGVWGKSIQFHYNTTTNTWEVHAPLPVAPPTSLQATETDNPKFGFSSLDVRAQVLWPDDVCNDFLNEGYGGKLQGTFAFSNAADFLQKLKYTTSLEYRMYGSDSSWLTSYQDIGYSVGFGLPFTLGSLISLVPEFETGLLMHFIDGDALQGDTGVFFDPVLRVASTVVVGKADNYQFVVSPNINWFFEDGGVGSQFGVDTGIRRNW